MTAASSKDPLRPDPVVHVRGRARRVRARDRPAAEIAPSRRTSRGDVAPARHLRVVDQHRPGPAACPSPWRTRSRSRPACPRTALRSIYHFCQPLGVAARRRSTRRCVPVGRAPTRCTVVVVPGSKRLVVREVGVELLRPAAGQLAPVLSLVCAVRSSGSVVQSSWADRVRLDEHVVPVLLGVVRGPERQVRGLAGRSPSGRSCASGACRPCRVLGVHVPTAGVRVERRAAREHPVGGLLAGELRVVVRAQDARRDQGVPGPDAADSLVAGALVRVVQRQRSTRRAGRQARTREARSRPRPARRRRCAGTTPR